MPESNNGMVNGHKFKQKYKTSKMISQTLTWKCLNLQCLIKQKANWKTNLEIGYFSCSSEMKYKNLKNNNGSHSEELFINMLMLLINIYKKQRKSQQMIQHPNSSNKCSMIANNHWIS